MTCGSPGTQIGPDVGVSPSAIAGSVGHIPHREATGFDPASSRSQHWACGNSRRASAIGWFPTGQFGQPKGLTG